MFGLEDRIVAETLDDGYPGSYFLGRRYHAAGRRAALGDGEHEAGLSERLGKCAPGWRRVSVVLCQLSVATTDRDDLLAARNRRAIRGIYQLTTDD
jgi:hypothetical protein